MQIDHLIYGAPDLSAAVADLEDRFGVRAQAGGSHPGLGTHNALLALGPRTYLEIIAPDPDQPEPSGRHPFAIGDLARGALVSWALTCDDIDQAVAAARSQGYDPGEIADGQRIASAGTVLRWRATGSARASGLVPFLISWGDTEHPEPASLTPALTALGVGPDVIPVARAAALALVATLSGPAGPQVLR